MDEKQPEQRERWKQYALLLAVRLGELLPRRVAYGLARLAGDAVYYARAGARRDVEDNMRHVLGEDAPAATVRAAAREAFRNVARYYLDLVRLARGNPRAFFETGLHIAGLEKLTSRLAKGQPVIVTTAHYGNPELVGVVLAASLGIDILALVEPLQPPAFARLMNRIRAAHGVRFLDVGFGGVAEALRHLRGGGCVAIVSDRDIQETGGIVPFFGAETRIPLGGVALAARTGATLLPIFCRRRGAGFDVVFEDPIRLANTGRPKEDALVNARALVERFELWIKTDPGQWMVLERIWETGASAGSPRATSAKEPRAPSDPTS